MSGVVAGGRDKKRRLIWPGLASVGGGVSHWWQANQEDGAGRLDWMGIKGGRESGRGTAQDEGIDGLLLGVRSRKMESMQRDVARGLNA